MKTESVAGVQPSVMRWARESIGMSIEDVALKLKRSPEEVMASPWFLTGPVEEMAEKLATVNARDGISYFTVVESQVDVMHKVMTQLRR